MKNYFADTMTQELAEFIRCLRYSQEDKVLTASWRRIAEHVEEKFNTSPRVCTGNQIDGKELCNAARDWFGEKDEDGWN